MYCTVEDSVVLCCTSDAVDPSTVSAWSWLCWRDGRGQPETCALMVNTDATRLAVRVVGPQQRVMSTYCVLCTVDTASVCPDY